MSLNFTGINNIKVGREEYTAIGMYQKLDNTLARGEKNFTEIKISAKLTDDEKGKDLSDYLKRVPNRFVNTANPDTVELHVKRFDVPDEKINQSSFQLNGKDLILDSDRKLPIMTFLARLTRQSSQNPELSTNQRIYMKIANKSIHKESVDYIETR